MRVHRAPILGDAGVVLVTYSVLECLGPVGIGIPYSGSMAQDQGITETVVF